MNVGKHALMLHRSIRISRNYLVANTDFISNHFSETNCLHFYVNGN